MSKMGNNISNYECSDYINKQKLYIQLWMQWIIGFLPEHYQGWVERRRWSHTCSLSNKGTRSKSAESVKKSVKEQNKYT